MGEELQHETGLAPLPAMGVGPLYGPRRTIVPMGLRHCFVRKEKHDVNTTAADVSKFHQRHGPELCRKPGRSHKHSQNGLPSNRADPFLFPLAIRGR